MPEFSRFKLLSIHPVHALINPDILPYGIPSFLYGCKKLFCTFILRVTEKMLQLQSSIWEDNNSYLCSFDPFSSSLFSVEVTDVKKLDIRFFHLQSASDKRYAILRGVWWIFYVMQKQFLFFWSPFSFYSGMPNCYVEANMLSDRWPTTFRRISYPKSFKSYVAKSSQLFI